MADRNNRPALKALFGALCASFIWPALLSPLPLAAGEALDGLSLMAAPAEPPAVPAVEIPAAPVPYAGVRPLKVYFLSVGQGDSEYIELPNGKNVLIDGGPSKSSHSFLANFLSMQLVRHIDYVVLTHPHADHYKGLHWVFNNFTVGRFYDTKMDNTGTMTDDQLREQVKGRSVSTAYPAAGDALDWDPAVSAKVLNSCPEPVQSDDGNSINNCSIVVRLGYRGSAVILTGDAEASVESAMIGRFGPELRSDVLKVAHHGSMTATSQAFLDVVKPSAAYISVGKNSYGLPTPTVIDRLKASGAKVRRTDEAGTQEVEFPLVPAAAGLETAAAR